MYSCIYTYLRSYSTLEGIYTGIDGSCVRPFLEGRWPHSPLWHVSVDHPPAESMDSYISLHVPYLRVPAQHRLI